MERPAAWRGAGNPPDPDHAVPSTEAETARYFAGSRSPRPAGHGFDRARGRLDLQDLLGDPDRQVRHTRHAFANLEDVRAQRPKIDARHARRQNGEGRGPRRLPAEIGNGGIDPLLADGAGDTRVLLSGLVGGEAISLRFNKRSLPYFTVWRNTAAEADGYKMSSIIMGVVKSDPFLMRQSQVTAN